LIIFSGWEEREFLELCITKQMTCGSRTYKPNSVRRIAPRGTAIPLGRASLRGSSDLPEGLTHRAGTCPWPKSQTSSLFGLAPCGVCLARDITAAAVRSYRTFSPLPRPAKAEAVYFLWHFPSTGLEPGLPDVIRHTALRSSDFPPLRVRRRRERPSGPAAYEIIISEGCSVVGLGS